METENTKAKNEYVVRKDLEEQTQVIISAVDTILDKRLGKVRSELKKDIGDMRDELYTVRDELKQDVGKVKNELYKELYIVRNELKEEMQEVKTGLDEKIDGVESRLGEKIDGVYTLVDGYVKTQEDSKQEDVIVKEELKQIKQVIGEKLGVEIRAI
jgi:hypothetical protein